MNKILTVILSLLFIAPTWAQDNTWRKSPELDALIAELKQHYASDDLSELKQEKMTQVDNLSFFIQYIDKPDTPEYKLLKAYLWGVQQTHIDSNYQQIQTNVVPWFCPKGGPLPAFSRNADNPTQFIENLIWETLEIDIQRRPNNLPKGKGMFKPMSGLIRYGLQIKYPCYDKVPQAHRVGSWAY
ncbi:hypothetical protein ACN930_002247 [Vibrio parahaemolyticus]|uniref:hypothetical protein n=1 Tax=Vibrio parahaemolyticus TaxID=670 RepID=UPI0004080A5D|nr:hypothetical protein [Vibrio parahaemolyticus]EGR7950940.1 hypothetical protein [Vibrio vulnificus]EGQ8923928.1 hypothetical protein [Vibrio parahaemolyticus]EGR2944431.1 hypothetical protein [Vibrio parahaemolyticus]EGR3065989.1 hypothetical protein [Vibrio parahaemolyticus]EHH1215350.1 hypothetical protein [Vibrio parahaemolyticus]